MAPLIVDNSKRLCECGRELYRPYNSRIWPKKCRFCFDQEKHKTKQSYLKPKIKPTEKQKAMKYADDAFSRYIRLKFSFEWGNELYCKCYTCNRTLPIKEIELGHYLRRNLKSLRFNENNGRPQCHYCNTTMDGLKGLFGQKLIQEIGIEAFDNLRQLSLFDEPETIEFYRENASKYRVKLNHLLRQRNLINPWKT